MQYIYCMSARLTLLLTLILAVPAVASDGAEDEVVSAIRARLDAVHRNDIAAWSSFVADEMMAPLEGALQSKQGWIRQHQSWPREVSYWYGPLEDVKVRVAADTAIATFHARQFTQIGALLLGVADGLIPPEPTAAKVDPTILAAYAGEYEWAPRLISKIEPRADRLLEHFGGSDSAEWLPESATTFFVPGAAAGGDSSRIIFVRDAAGRVTHYIYRELGATDRIVRKVK